MSRLVDWVLIVERASKSSRRQGHAAAAASRNSGSLDSSRMNATNASTVAARRSVCAPSFKFFFVEILKSLFYSVKSIQIYNYNSIQFA